MQANDCKDHKEGNLHDRSQSMILITMMFCKSEQSQQSMAMRIASEKTRNKQQSTSLLLLLCFLQ
jgi:hypothetical protein